MFRSIFTANDNYPVQDSGNFSCAIQMHWSFKPKNFSDFFVLFLESTSNVKHFEKKDDCHTYFIWEITEYEKLGWITLQKTPFQNTVCQSTCSRVPNSSKICLRAISSDFFIIMGDPNLENVSLSDLLNPRGVS